MSLRDALQAWNPVYLRDEPPMYSTEGGRPGSSERRGMHGRACVCMCVCEGCLSPCRVTSLKKIKRKGKFLNIFLVQWSDYQPTTNACAHECMCVYVCLFRCGYKSSGEAPPPSWLSEAVLDERYPRLIKTYYKNRRVRERKRVCLGHIHIKRTHPRVCVCVCVSSPKRLP